MYQNEGQKPVIDPFVAMNPAGAPGDSKARISATVQRSLQYGEIKCSFTVTVSCVQEKACMDYAAEQAFAQAVRYVNDGMDWIAPGLPSLPVPQ